jgi:hypothetical protein
MFKLSHNINWIIYANFESGAKDANDASALDGAMSIYLHIV